MLKYTSAEFEKVFHINIINLKMGLVWLDDY